MKRLLYIGLLITALAKMAAAQEQLSTIQQADKLYQRYEYYKAVQLYLRGVKKGKNDVRLLERIADCYRNINQYDNAEKWYAQVVADPKASRMSHFYYAEVLQRDEKFDAARAQYRIFYSDDITALNRKLADCDSAAAWMKQASDYQLKNMLSLNSESSDWGLTYEGKTGLMFTSDRVNDPDNLDDRTGNNWFKLYEVDESGEHAILTDVYTKDGVSMSDRYHFGPIAFNALGDTAYITATTADPKKQLPNDKDRQGKTSLYTRRLELMIAVKKGRVWAFDSYFPYDNEKEYSVGDAALSPDGKILYFSSDMPGGFGKTDIWYCEMQPDGTWSKPVNCGPVINTTEEDEFPNISSDGALYYASKGLPGMGGYDIYRAWGEKTQWTTPEDLKYPVNSTSDDFYLVTKDGYAGYLSSNREGGKGNDDIYAFMRTKRPPPPKLIAKKDTPASQPVTPALHSGLVLGIIYYDLDKSDIRPDAVPEMDKLVALMKQRPALRIELSSHTDSRASENYNMALSQRRASAAAIYLEERGIDASRLELTYHGETELVNKCADGVPCTEPEHQLNRRTEFKVISGGN